MHLDLEMDEQLLLVRGFSRYLGVNMVKPNSVQMGGASNEYLCGVFFVAPAKR
jgi:hypothetical protein